MAREVPQFLDRAALSERVTALAATALPQNPPPGTDEQQVVSWLTRLHLLQGVPLGYLVPDIRMLPAESVRFFQVDYAWIEALIDGAFSIGSTPATVASAAMLRTVAASMARARLHSVRAALTGTEPAGAAPTASEGTGAAGTSQAPEAITGFLLRSAVVSGWPGLEVHGYADTGALRPLPLLRLERVAPSVLFCLLGGVLQRVDLQEPPEGVHFGVSPAPPAAQSPWEKQLRYASGGTVGGQVPNGVVPVPLRTGTTVLRADALAQAMAPLVWAAPPPGRFTAAQFGLEMVQGVQSVSFQAVS